MKQFLSIAFLLSVIIATATAQEEQNCYYKWQLKFDKRGAKTIPDGEHENVIITIREGADASCYLGKCVVVNKIVTKMFVQLEDGEYEPFEPEARYNFPITITNGISKTLPTLDNELIDILFINHLKPKKANYKLAPDPDDY